MQQSQARIGTWSGITTGALLGAMAVLCLIQTPPLQAQDREILQLQRDMAQMQNELSKLRSDQNEKLASLEGLINQAIQNSSGFSAAMTALEGSLTKTLADQSDVLTEPVAVMRTRVDQVSQDTGALRENVAAMNRRLTTMEATLQDISRAVKTLSTAAVAPPAPVNSYLESSDILITNAIRDFSSGRDDLAMQQLFQFLMDYPDSANAPVAYYHMGMLYERAEPAQFDDAIEAYDAVLERFPENPTTREARFRKALTLQKAGRRADAATEFQAFIDAYPTDPNVGQARARLTELGR